MDKEAAKEFIKKVHIGHLATIGLDNAPRVRPVGASIFYGDDVYFFTLSTRGKHAEMQANPQVEIVWFTFEDETQVHIRGKASLVTDEALRQRFREQVGVIDKLVPEELRPYYVLYKVHPEKVEMSKGFATSYTEIPWYA
jgi:uncharacterized pyridoxamine 5'-phosphate oxidase family protein